jgi:hypothetical protein
MHRPTAQRQLAQPNYTQFRPAFRPGQSLSRNQGTAASAAVAQSVQDEVSPEDEPLPSSEVAQLAASEQVVLQTAKTVAYSPWKGEQKISVRVLLDGGSSRSYVTDAVVKALKLPITRSESLSVSRFFSD